VKQSDLNYQLGGWALFVLCAAMFIVSSLKSGDLLLLFGSIVFLAACILFLIPLVKQLKDK
jgi:hypothetical protein